MVCPPGDTDGPVKKNPLRWPPERRPADARTQGHGAHAIGHLTWTAGLRAAVALGLADEFGIGRETLYQYPEDREL